MIIGEFWIWIWWSKVREGISLQKRFNRIRLGRRLWRRIFRRRSSQGSWILRLLVVHRRRWSCRSTLSRSLRRRRSIQWRCRCHPRRLILQWGLCKFLRLSQWLHSWNLYFVSGIWFLSLNCSKFLEIWGVLVWILFMNATSLSLSHSRYDSNLVFYFKFCGSITIIYFIFVGCVCGMSSFKIIQSYYNFLSSK